MRGFFNCGTRIRFRPITRAIRRRYRVPPVPDDKEVPVKSSLPADFNPWLAMDALQGLTEALYWQLTEGPAAEELRDGKRHASLVGLAYAARKLARELNAYFRAASEAGFEFPANGDSPESVNDARGNWRVN